MREDSMLARIHDAEHSQHVAELSQKISQLEMKVCLLYTFANQVSSTFSIEKRFLFLFNRTNKC